MKKLFLFLLLLSMPVFASAHATPVVYSPEASVSVATSPNEIQIHFSERIEQSASSINVFLPDGTKAKERAEVSPLDAHYFHIEQPKGGDGAYTVSWQVVSQDDGHFTKGAYTFFVGTGSPAVLPPESFSIMHSSGNQEATTIFLKLLGEGMIIGLFALLLLFGREVVYRTEVRERVRVLGERFFLTALFMLGLGTSAYIYLKTSALALAQRVAMQDVFCNYTVTMGGLHSWMLLLATPILGVIAFPLVGRMTRGEHLGMRGLLAFAILLAMSYTQARLSHAAASEILPMFSVGVNVVHLFGKGLWIGGLFALTCVFIPAFLPWGMYDKERHLLQIAFMRVIGFAIILGGASGAWIVWLHLKDFSNISTSDWGHQFLLLSTFAGILLLLRMLAFAIFEHMKRCVACGWSFYLLEFFVGLGVTFFSALVIITTPPLVHSAPWHKTEVSQGAQLTLTEDRTQKGALLLTAVDSTGVALDGIPIVTLKNSEASIGPIVTPTEKRFEGGFGIDGNVFAPPGVWDINFTLQRNQAYDVNAKFIIDYPEVILAYNEQQKTPHLAIFDIAMLTFGVGALLLGLLLLGLLAQERRNIRDDGNDISGEAPIPMGNFLKTGLSMGVAFVMLLVVVVALNSHFFLFDFQKKCVMAGGMWHSSPPMKNGKVLASLAQNGCMMGMGSDMYHFVDEREFDYHLRTHALLHAHGEHEIHMEHMKM